MFRSVRSIVIAPANTGRDRRRRIAVILIPHTNRGTDSKFIPFGRMFITVVMKLIEARIEEAPARCIEKIAKSTDGPACAMFPASGG
jgi:hypothetical protein